VTVRQLVRWTLLVLVFAIPWENIVYLGGVTRISKLLGAVAFVVWLMAVLATGRIRKPAALHIAVLLFVLWNLSSVLWSEDIPTTVEAALTFVQLGLFVYLLWETVTTHHVLCQVMQAYVLGCSVSLVSLFIDYARTGNEYSIRFTTGNFEVNSLGLILGLALPFAWYLALNWRPHVLTRTLPIVDLVYIPLAVLAVLLTGSRSALASLLPGLVYIAIGLIRLGASRRLLLSLVLGGLAIVLFSQSLVPERTIERLSTTGSAIEGGSFGGRVDEWSAALTAFQDHPITGVGSGAFQTIGTLKDAHNFALRFLAELGLVGFGLFVAILFLTVTSALRQPGSLAWLWISLLLVWLIGASVHNFESRKQTWLVFGLVAASAALPARRAQTLVAEPPSPASLAPRTTKRGA
jgi:O-antigen ligase